VFLAKIHVTLKKSVLDPQGVAVCHAAQSLGFKDIQSVRIGKYMEVKIGAKSAAAAKAEAEALCKKLLANLVIEHYELSVEKA
jgi:phosphoribosylformylglycinamidine synthase PurS subunit